MSSRDGLGRAEIDVGLLSDPKVGKLLRLQGNDWQRTALTMFLFQATILASWKANEPLMLSEAAPLWYLGDVSSVGEMTSDLTAAGLLDADGRIPVETLDRWMAMARARVSKASDAAQARWGTTPAMPKQSSGSPRAMPVDRERDRENRERVRERDGSHKPANDGVKPRSLRDIVEATGVSLPWDTKPQAGPT